MNIAEILKNVPKGTKLYCTIVGDVELLEINDGFKYPIRVKHCNSETCSTFSEEGKISIEYPNSECILFPSKENRDWSTFKVEKSYEFKPFDKVLVRDADNNQWMCNIYSHTDSDGVFPYKCIYSEYKQCIPFEGYEDLVGTTISPDSIYPA